MWDKLDIRIPFDLLFVNESVSGESGNVDASLYDFPLSCAVVFIDGSPHYEMARAQKWSSIASSLSKVAVGFFPNGNGFYPWPHVSIKASPSKILQGHNVFGSENIRQGAMQMLAYFKLSFPKIAAHLSFIDAEVRYLDSTYSAVTESDFFHKHIINSFDRLVPDSHVRSRYEGYLQLHGNSTYRQQKIYSKPQELLADREKAKKTGEKERFKILSNPQLLDFAANRIRFEATTGHSALERDGIPTKLNEFLKFHDWYEATHNEPLCQLLWRRAFKKLFSQMEGHTMKNCDLDNIKLQIEAKFLKLKSNGKVCRRKSNAVFRTFRQIKSDGYDILAQENNSSFYANVKCLLELGLSKSYLKSLDANKPNENVIPMLRLIDIDFSNQKPDWYIEPVASFTDPRRHLQLVA
jgi:II/X family phage/plasmid replication protein